MKPTDTPEPEQPPCGCELCLQRAADEAAAIALERALAAEGEPGTPAVQPATPDAPEGTQGTANPIHTKEQPE